MSAAEAGEERSSAAPAELDFRSRIQEKLSAKQSKLGQVEEHIKKYGGGGRGQHFNNKDPMARFQNRLGPKVGGGVGGASGGLGGALNRRLGPKVGPDVDEGGGPESGHGIKSMVVVHSEERSREEALEEMKTKDKKDVQVNRSGHGRTNPNKIGVCLKTTRFSLGQSIHF